MSPALATPRLRVAVVVFPGSNCDRDAKAAAETVMKADARLLFHDATDLGDPDLVILPGGFAHGDYLRAGAMARFSRVMESVAQYAARGGAVLGICNGFQVLCEAGLLPGALLRNSGLRFLCRDVFVRVETTRTPFTATLSKGDVLRMPIAHGEGSFQIAAAELARLIERDQIVFRYTDARGERVAGANPNGSLDDVAGIANREGNVVGLMPHPERACEDLLGGTDGARLFLAAAHTLATRSLAA